MDNVEEMDKFLEKYNFPKLNQEEMENLNRLITSMEIKTIIRNLFERRRGPRTAGGGLGRVVAPGRDNLRTAAA